MGGTFLYGSRPAQQDDVAAILGPDAVPRPYVRYVQSLPGWSGIGALGLFWTIALTSEPHVRKWSYELFQGGHLLMFPMIGLVCAHGTAKLLQFPMMGFWLAVPTLLVLGERLHRVYRGFVRLPSTLELLDKNTAMVTVRKPGGKPWSYSAGQYVFLQVPAISWLQWHPFTISHCADDINGMPGRPGPAGKDGMPGASGRQGDNGDMGRPGQDGAPGAQGPPGPAGLKGKVGACGNIGAPGANGPVGAPGADSEI